MNVHFYAIKDGIGPNLYSSKEMDAVPSIGDAVYCNGFYRVFNVKWELGDNINVIVYMTLEEE